MGFVEGEGSTQDVNSRLFTAWSTNNLAEACGILLDTVVPRCIKWLLGKFAGQGLSYEDCEDCVDHGVEGLLRRNPEQINNPYSYVFTSAKNAALDMLQERKHFVRYDPEWRGDDEDQSGDWRDVPQLEKITWNTDTMLMVAEAALDVELTARDEQLRQVFQIALPKLAPGRRRLVEALLEHGATVANAVLADIMNQSETAIKSLKSRTFMDLRRLLPVTADELGINFDSLVAPEPEVLTRDSDIPSEDEGL